MEYDCLLSLSKEPKKSDNDIEAFKIIALDAMGISKTPVMGTVVPKSALNGMEPFTAETSRKKIKLNDGGRYEIREGYIHCFLDSGLNGKSMAIKCYVDDVVEIHIYRVKIKSGTPYYEDGINFICAKEIEFIEKVAEYELADPEDMEF